MNKVEPVDIVPTIPAEAAAALVEFGGKVLSLDPSDVCSVNVSISVEPIELPGGESGGRRFEAGPQRVTIDIDLAPGARAAWVDK